MDGDNSPIYDLKDIKSLINHAERTLGNNSTGCYRGFYGKWEIKEEKIYLVENPFYKDMPRKYRTFPLLASWYSGTIYLAGDVWKGPEEEESISYANYYFTYPKHVSFLEFKNGVLIKKGIISGEEYEKIREREYEKLMGKFNSSLVNKILSWFF